MLDLPIDNWQYLHDAPHTSGKIKQSLDDFQVDESLSFEPSNKGEHTLIQIKKTGLNTAFVAEEMAKFAKLPLRQISYAGRKDKYATTTQWFGVYYANRPKCDWQQFALEGAKVQYLVQNDRKLRVGAIKCNRFTIYIRELSNFNEDDLTTRLELIKRHGVPNYFGNQRFGELIKADGSVQVGGNLQLAAKLLNGEEIRNRNKRSMAISALRSWLFNQFVSARIEEFKANDLIEGDALLLAGTNSFFNYSKEQSESAASLFNRLQQQDIFLSAPLWGKGELQSQDSAKEFEQQVSQAYPQVCQILAELGLEQQRRALLLFPQDFEAEISDNCLRLSFSLPTGCFATSVLREIAKVSLV